MRILIAILLCFSLSGQVNQVLTISPSGDEVITTYPRNALLFQVSDGATVHVNIVKDSLSWITTYYIYVYFDPCVPPRNYEATVLFSGGGLVTLKPTYIDYSDSYYEYAVPDQIIVGMRSMPVAGFIFESEEDVVSCVTTQGQFHFIDFLSGN